MTSASDSLQSSWLLSPQYTHNSHWLSHQRSWWIVHTQPTPDAARPRLANPTNAVGGLFISACQRDRPTLIRNPTDLQARPNRDCRLSMNDPPTALVGFQRDAALFLVG